MGETCYICGKPATQAVNVMIGAAASTGSLMKPVCAEHGWSMLPNPDPRDATIATLAAALEEARGAIVASRSFVEIVYEETDREEAADAKIVMGQIDAAVATINAALGRVEG